MNSQMLPIGKIKPNTGQIQGLPANPRFIKDDSYEKLKKSIQDDPDMLELRELLVYPINNEFIVIAGNMRLRAASELGHKKVPCKVLPENTTVEKLKAITIKDNVPFGSWDYEILANEWDADELNDWGLFIPEQPTEINLDDFFSEDINSEKEGLKKIELHYSDDDYEKVIAAFKEIGGSKEKVVYNLLVR